MESKLYTIPISNLDSWVLLSKGNYETCCPTAWEIKDPRQLFETLTRTDREDVGKRMAITVKEMYLTFFHFHTVEKRKKFQCDSTESPSIFWTALVRNSPFIFGRENTMKGGRGLTIESGENHSESSSQLSHRWKMKTQFLRITLTTSEVHRGLE